MTAGGRSLAEGVLGRLTKQASTLPLDAAVTTNIPGAMELTLVQSSRAESSSVKVSS